MNLMPILLGMAAPPPMTPQAKCIARRHECQEETIDVPEPDPAVPGLVHFTVPGDPVPKGRPIFSRINDHVLTRTPQKTVRHENIVGRHARKAMGSRAPFTGPLLLTVTFYCPIPTSWTKTRQRLAITDAMRPTVRPDLDNFIKLVCDAMNGICYYDDAQITDMRVQKRYGEIASTDIELTVIDGVEGTT